MSAVNLVARRLGVNQSVQSLIYTAEYQTYLDRLTALGYTYPTDVVRNATSLLVADLIAAGFWDRCHYFRLLFSGSLQTTTVNLKAPTLHQLTIVGTPLFTEGAGCKSQASAYFTDPFNIDTGIQHNNYCSVMYVSESSTSLTNCFLHGVNMGGSIYFAMSPKFQGNVSPIVFHFFTTGTSFTNPNHKGLYVQTSKKGGANGMNLWKDGTLLATNNNAVMNPFSTGRTILALNNIPAGQGVGNFYPFNCALDAAFDAFDSTDEAAFRAIWETYKTRAGLP